MHLVIGYRNSFQVKVLHAIDLKLEGERRLQMTIDTIFCELQRQEQVALNIKRVYNETGQMANSYTPYGLIGKQSMALNSTLQGLS